MQTHQLRLFKLFLVVGLSFISVLTFRAQNELKELPTEKSWREFNLDSTTSEEVIKSLGRPKKNELKKVEESLPKDLTGSPSLKEFRVLTYKKVENYDSIEFTFADNALVGMNFLIRQNKMKGLANRKSDLLPAKNLSDVFKTDFIIFKGLPKGAKLSDFEGQKETTVPKVYKQIYSLLGIAKDSVILVSVDNTNFKSGLKEVFDKPTVEIFPGFAQRIQIVSRTFTK